MRIRWRKFLRRIALWTAIVFLAAWHWPLMAQPVDLANAKFPRLMGMNIGDKNYDDPVYQAQLARMDIVILGFYRGWVGSLSQQPIRDAVRALKKTNPKVLVGQYTILSEANDDDSNTPDGDKQSKLRTEDWWLRRADGSRVQWTDRFRAWDINVTGWSKADTGGERYPEWVAQRDYRVFFGPVPEFDIWYFDNVLVHPLIASADWKRDGRDQVGDDPQVQAAYRRAHALEWEKARALAPRRLLMGNVDNDLGFPEYKGKLQAVFLEALMGKSWSLHTYAGWERMMDRYHSVFHNLARPRIVGFNVVGKQEDYRFLRLALSSCLMDDGYFSFTDAAKGHSSVPWFDEYDVKLGRPLDPPQIKPWRDGVYRRRFENGMVLVNPGLQEKRVDIDGGYAHFKGKQAPEINDGRPVETVLLAPGDGVLLAKTHP